MVNADLPHGMKPHDSDPPEQKVWTGLVHGTVKVHRRTIIRRCDGCVDEREAIELAQGRLLSSIRRRNPGIDCEAGDDVQTEPD